MLNHSFQGFHQHTWLQAATELEKNGKPYALITVLGTTGSTPRASGTKMVISQENIYATIGGGHLEFKVIAQARELLKQGKACQQIKNVQLSSNLGQCCGGSTTIMFEVFCNNSLQLDIYGAGHIAHSLIFILAQLPIRIRWIDSRADIFPTEIPTNVQKIVDEEPVEQIHKADPNSAFLILTHNHMLDFSLCQAVLKRGDSMWLGVIGSKTKSKKFQHRLSHRGFTQDQIQQLTCPIGLSQVKGKLPMEVAVSIAGELIEIYQNHQDQSGSKNGVQWPSLQAISA